jgi:hypothetical protein
VSTTAILKFRCYRCGRLLGVSRNKIGSQVSCPKCGAGLIVPDPTDTPVSTDEKAPPGEDAPPVIGGVDLSVPSELLDIRPEDIRVEPGIVISETLPPPFVLDVEPEVELPIEIVPTVEAPAKRSREDPASPLPIPPIEISPTNAPPVGPAIDLLAQKVAASRGTPAPRARDVVLPRSVVMAWSLFVLLAQALAFLAGLLAGHFLWRVH